MIINTLAFRVSYLLGVSNEYLQKYYSEEYEKSKNLSLFENYIDTPILRSLSKIRQYFYMNYISYYSSKKENQFPKWLKADFDFLNKYNIPLLEIYRLSKLSEFLNIVNDMVLQIGYKVFIDLEIPFPEKMMSLFSFKKVSDKHFKDYCAEIVKNISYHEVVIPNGEKISVTLKYMFHSDINLLKSIYSIHGDLFDLEVEELDLNFKYREEKGEDLDKSSKINGNSILNELQSRKVIVYSNEKIENKKPVVEIKEMSYFTGRVDNFIKIIDTIQKKNSHIIFDNQSIPQSICEYLLKVLCSKTTNISYITKLDNIYVCPNIGYTKLSVKKCYTDVDIGLVLSQIVCQRLYREKVKNLVLITNNKELIDMYSFENCNFIVFTFNREIKIPNNCGKVYYLDEFSMERDNELLNQIILDNLTSMPINQLTNSSLENNVLKDLEKMSGYISFDLKSVKEYINSYFKTIGLNVRGKEIILYFNNQGIKKV